tara:strand:+ start:8058 stop:8495 length:438 start_codon:yes stop_codon:yes gene_type:complete
MDPLAMREFNRSLPMRMLRAREVFMKLFRPILNDYGITEQQWRVLRALLDEGEMSGQALSRKCCLSGPSLSRIISLLSKKGYIIKRIQPDDQRYMLIRLAPAGKKLCEEMSPRIEEKYRAAESIISPQQQEQLHRLLDQIIDREE